MEKFSPFEKLVGKNISDGQREKVLKHGENMFNDQNFKGLENEREKTAEELEMISIANKETNKIRQKYGLPDFDVPSKNIHIVSEQDWHEEASLGAYYSVLQAIGIGESTDIPQKIWLMHGIFHEMLHFKSYNAFQLVDNDNSNARDLKAYRSGLSVHTRDGKDKFLGSINEAVIEEMTKKFIKRLPSDSIFNEEISQTKKITEDYSNLINAKGEKLNDDDFIYARIMDEDVDNHQNPSVWSLGFTYKTQRKNLNTIITKLFYRNFGDFENKEQIFDIFEKAVMTGNILPIGKLIDSTFGEGTLRKIGELDDFSNEEQEAFINSL